MYQWGLQVWLQSPSSVNPILIRIINIAMHIISSRWNIRRCSRLAYFVITSLAYIEYNFLYDTMLHSTSIIMQCLQVLPYTWWSPDLSYIQNLWEVEPASEKICLALKRRKLENQIHTMWLTLRKDVIRGFIDILGYVDRLFLKSTYKLGEEVENINRNKNCIIKEGPKCHP